MITKHKIFSDNETFFDSMLAKTKEQLESMGERIIRVKIYKKKENNDYNGYNKNYLAYIWTKPKTRK